MVMLHAYGCMLVVWGSLGLCLCRFAVLGCVLGLCYGLCVMGRFVVVCIYVRLWVCVGFRVCVYGWVVCSV